MDCDMDFKLSRAEFVLTNTGKIQQFYNTFKEVGKGAYGTVFCATVKNQPDKIRAIKIIRKSSLKQPNIFFNEINILKKLDHPNIVKIFETFEDEKNYYIVLDFCEGGQLFDRLTERGNFNENDAREIFKQILYAIKYCHTQKIAHRDLKPENFLLMNKSSLSIKLIDFGLSIEWKEDLRKELKEKGETKLIGTSYYIAPEILKGSYDERCDIWSLGVILYILVTAVPPFDGEDDKQIMNAVRNGEYSLQIPEMKGVSKELKDLIAKILKPDEQRITIEEIYNHPWMKVELSKQTLKLNYGKITNYQRYSKLKKFAVAYIASQLPGKDIQKLGNIFQQIDSDHNGLITMSELKEILQKQKQKFSTAQIDNLFKIIDTNHSGKIDYSEFVACCLQNSVIFKQENLRKAFSLIDKDQSGTITREELRQALLKTNENLNENLIEEIISSCDKNADGVIDFREFLGNISQL